MQSACAIPRLPPPCFAKQQPPPCPPSCASVSFSSRPLMPVGRPYRTLSMGRRYACASPCASHAVPCHQHLPSPQHASSGCLSFLALSSNHYSRTARTLGVSHLHVSASLCASQPLMCDQHLPSAQRCSNVCFFLLVLPPAHGRRPKTPDAFLESQTRVRKPLRFPHTYL